MSVNIDRRGSKIDFAVALLHDWVEDFTVNESDGSAKDMTTTTPEFIVFNQNGSVKLDLSTKLIKSNGHLGWLVPKIDLTTLTKGSWRYVLSITEAAIKEPWMSGLLIVDNQYSERLTSTSRNREIKVSVSSGVILHAGVNTSFGGDMTAHLLDPTPHPVYDDLPSLTLLFDNGLV